MSPLVLYTATFVFPLTLSITLPNRCTNHLCTANQAERQKTAHKGHNRTHCATFSCLVLSVHIGVPSLRDVIASWSVTRSVATKKSNCQSGPERIYHPTCDDIRYNSIMFFWVCRAKSVTDLFYAVISPHEEHNMLRKVPWGLMGKHIQLMLNRKLCCESLAIIFSGRQVPLRITR